MKFLLILPILGSVAFLAAQSGSKAIVINLNTANWTHEKGDPPGSEGVMVRTDPTTGGMDLLVGFPAGHVIAPHFHDSNERIFVAEGQLSPWPRKVATPISMLAALRSFRRTRCSVCPAVRRRAVRFIFPGTANPIRIPRNRAAPRPMGPDALIRAGSCDRWKAYC